MVAPAWLAELLHLDGEIEEDDLAGRLAQRLRLQVPTGPEGVAVLTRFSLLAETLYKEPESLVQEALPASPDEAAAAAAQLGLRTKSDLERILRLAARELWAYLTARQQASAPARTRDEVEEDERLAAFAAQAIAEVRGEKPPAAPEPATAASAAPTAGTPEQRLEELAAQAIAEVRGEKPPAASQPATAAPPAAAATAVPVPLPAPVQSPAPSGAAPSAEPPAPLAAARPPAPRTFNEQLEAAGPLIVFLATVGAGAIFFLLVWLIGTAVGVFGNGNV